MKKINWEKIRIFIIFFCILGTSAVIIGRAFYLQVIAAKFLENKFTKQTNKIITIPGKRGKILDSKGDELAVSIKVDSIYATPMYIKEKNKKRIAKILSTYLGLSYIKIFNKLNQKKFYVCIKRKVSKTKTEKIKFLMKKYNLKGLDFIEEYKRVYPYHELAANVIGFCSLSTNKGLEGIEYKFNNYLQGKNIKIKILKDGTTKKISLLKKDIIKQAVGSNIMLTINKKVQGIIENEINIWAEKYHAKRAIAIAMNPNTGEIKAMASYPSFDPNYYFKYPHEFFRNLAINYNYEPGSTIKPIVVAWGLSKKLLNLDWVYKIGNGYLRYKSIDIHDHGVHKWLNIEGIVVHSSNIGMTKIADYLGPRNISKIFQDFEFGKYTGIELPGENKGIVKKLKYYSPVTHVTMAFGQGIAITPLQLIKAYSALINGGYLLKPYIVDKIIDNNNHIIKKTQRTVIKKVISETASNSIKKVLIKTVEIGTGKNAKLKIIKIGGKTGTAQIPAASHKGYLKGEYISSFIGFFPAEKPSCILLLIIERPQKKYYASEVVCPIFKKISTEIMSYFGIDVFNINYFAQNDSDKSQNNPVMHKNRDIILGKTKIEVLNYLRNKKIKNYKLIGNGFAVKRYIKNGEIIIEFKES